MLTDFPRRPEDPAARPPRLVTRASEQDEKFASIWLPGEKRRVGCGCAVVGGFFLAAGLFLAWKNAAMLACGARTTAEIIRVERDESRNIGRQGRTSVTYRPILKFFDHRGRERESKPSVTGGIPPHVGEKWDIYYNPDDASASVLPADILSIGLLPGVFLLVGLGGLFGGRFFLKRR